MESHSLLVTRLVSGTCDVMLVHWLACLDKELQYLIIICQMGCTGALSQLQLTGPVVPANVHPVLAVD